MSERKKLLFLANPHAGKSALKSKFLPIVDLFVKRGYQVTVYTTQRSGELPGLIPELVSGFDLLVCCGGDGTLNETINGLMNCPSPPLLGYIPAGTTNDFAASFRLPKDMLKAAQNVVNGIPIPFDVGRFGNNAYFAYVAAFGAFTDVTYETPQGYKNVLGKTAYILEGASRLPTIQSYNITLEHDGGMLEDDILIGIITNSKYVAGLPMGRMVDASMNDGIMEVLLLKKPHSILNFAPIINNFLMGEIDPKYVHVLKTKKLKLSCDRLISWTLDGEYGGAHRNIEVENLPCALNVIVPIESVIPQSSKGKRRGKTNK